MKKFVVLRKFSNFEKFWSFEEKRVGIISEFVVDGRRSGEL